MKQQIAADWGRMMDDLLRAGVDSRAIGLAMGGNITDRMIRMYRTGVQPTHWRGEALMVLWCKTTGRDRATAPTCAIKPGHRAGRGAQRPRDEYSAGYLTAWAQVGATQVAPVKNKGRQPRKVKVEA